MALARLIDEVSLINRPSACRRLPNAAITPSRPRLRQGSGVAHGLSYRNHDAVTAVARSEVESQSSSRPTTTSG